MGSKPGSIVPPLPVHHRSLDLVALSFCSDFPSLWTLTCEVEWKPLPLNFLFVVVFYHNNGKQIRTLSVGIHLTRRRADTGLSRET